MKMTKPGLAAVAALTAVLLLGCPAEEKKTDTTTTTTTSTSTAPSVGTTSDSASTSTVSTTTTTTDASGAAKPTTASSGTSADTAASGSNSKPAAGTTVANANGIDAKAIFSQKCAGCHGANGGGGMGPSLQHVAAKGDAFIHARIMKGSATKGMPAFGDSGMLKAPEVDALVSYVKTL